MKNTKKYSKTLDEMVNRIKDYLDKNPEKCEFLLPVVVGDMMKDGSAQVKVMESIDKWYGVTYAEDKPVVVAALAELTQKGFYPNGLWN